MIKKIVCLLVSVIMLGLVGCSKNTATLGDIITQKASGNGKIDVTVLVKYAFGINEFERVAEEKFSNLNIIQVGNYTSDMGINEYTARLKNDDLTDIVMTWPLDAGAQYVKNRLIDLSTFSAASEYTSKSLNAISSGEQGQLYYLPGPSQVRGIVYNKTLFTEKGWQVPKDYNGFINLCKQIEEDGIRSLQLGLANSEVLDTAFTGYGFSSCYANPSNAKKLQAYNNGIGSFADNFMPALQTFKDMIEAGIFKPQDLEIGYSKRENMLFNRECAMIEDSVLMARMGGDLTGSTDEFALMPFFNPGVSNDWARLYNVCFIGLNKHLEDKGSEKKYKLVKQLVDFISTTEGQNALAGDTGAMFSSLKGAVAPDVVEIESLKTALNGGRYGVFPTLKNAQDALRTGLAGMLSGTHAIDDVVKLVDHNNLMPAIKAPALTVGYADQTFSLTQTGNFVADSIRQYVNADIGLFLDNGKDGLYNGKGISGKIYQGDITLLDIKRILPDLKHGEKGVLQKVTMTGENLIKTLEYAIPVYNQKSGWFYYFSGLKVKYDVCAAPGRRIKAITDSQGNKIDPLKVYSIAAMDFTLPQEFILSMEDTNLTINLILEKTIARAKTISPITVPRFTV